MAFTLTDIRQALTDFAGDDGSYAQFLAPELLKHFKAGANAAWRDGYDLERDERRYEDKHGGKAGDAFSAGFVYAASYM